MAVKTEVNRKTHMEVGEKEEYDRTHTFLDA